MSDVNRPRGTPGSGQHPGAQKPSHSMDPRRSAGVNDIGDRAEASPWTYLETFDLTVTSPSNKLFQNGRQQVEITIKLRGTDDAGAIRPITDTQRASIRLIDYQSGAILPAVPASGRVESGWGSTRQRNSFGFHPTATMPSSSDNAAPNTTTSRRDTAASTHQHAPASDDAAGYQYVVLYVQTAESAPKEIGALLQRDSTTTFRSNDDAIKTSVEVLPQRTPLAMSIQAMDPQWEQVRVEGDADNEWDLTTVDYGYCGLSMNGQRLKISAFSVSPASMCLWDSSNPNSDLLSFTGYAGPGDTTVQYNVPSAFASRKHARVTMPRQNEGVIVLVRNQGIKQSSVSGTTQGPCNIDIVDEYGNDHPMRIAFKAGDRNALTLSRR